MHALRRHYGKVIIGIILLSIIYYSLRGIPSLLVISLSYLLLYRYTTLFLIVFLSGLIIPLPVNIMLVAVGAFSHQQYFNFTLCLVVATVANLIGDIGAYYFFAKFGKKILRDKYAKKYSFFTRLERYFADHSGLSVFVSRIVGIFGTPVNFLSGYMRISFAKFMFYDITGNFTFVLIFLSIGYEVGDAWVNTPNLINTITNIVAVVIIALIAFAFYKKRRVL